MNPDILIIDGNANSRAAMAAALEAAGHNVLEANDGKAALVQMTKTPAKMIVLDLALAADNAAELVAQLRAVDGAADVPILALTSLHSKADRRHAPEARLTGFLFKPVDMNLLLDIARGHLGAANSAERRSNDNQTVLAVTDQPSQRKLLALHLRQLGFNVATAGDGAEGLALARRYRPIAIVADVLMPRVDGYELCAQVRADPSLAATPLILVSNRDVNDEDRRLAERKGVTALVPTAPDFHDAKTALLKIIRTPSVNPPTDTIIAQHRDRLVRQLDRQTSLNYELARRCAAQSAQLSVLAQMSENFLDGSVSQTSLHSDLLAQLVDAVGYSWGAILCYDRERRLGLSASVGCRGAMAKSLPIYFEPESPLAHIQQRAEPMLISASDRTGVSARALLATLGAKSLLVSRLRFGREDLGVVLLASDSLSGDTESLGFAKIATQQIARVIALHQTIARLQHLASFDALTALPNRAYLNWRLQTAAGNGGNISLFLLNLDHFHEVNNAISYRNGNALLQQVASRLRTQLPAAAVVARLGADEFAVLRSDLNSTEAVRRAARDMLKCLEPTFKLTGLPVALRGTMGVAHVPASGNDGDAILTYADMARRAAKRTANDFLIYPDNVQPYLPDRLVLLGELREAMDRNELSLHYQPKVSLGTGAVLGVEALLRWHHPARGWVNPEHFLSLAEGAGLIRPITLWVVRSALRQARVWRAEGTSVGVAVNISSHDLQDAAFPQSVAELCQAAEVPSRELRLELTERSLIADPPQARETLQHLNELGIGLSIDDFGTGYASFSSVQNFPVEEIKIDASFIHNFVTDPCNGAIVRSIIDLGRNLDIPVVAEGIESPESWDALGELGCNLGQGYYVARPMPAPQLANWFAESRTAGCLIWERNQRQNPTP